MTVVPVVDEGLGNSSYLVDLGDGRAMVVDVSVDLRSPAAALERRGLTVAFAADTHLHADFLSGARRLSVQQGAQVLASADGHRQFGHRGLHDGDEVDLGGLRLRALGTPGHTHEHLAFLLLDGDRPLGVFTGGSLIVGAAARTDLVSPDQTESLARAQYASLQRLIEFPDDVAVWPTHGAGSFCSAPPGADRVSTIGREKATNSLLQADSEDAFVKELLGSLGSFPPYFLKLAETNRRGPTVVDPSIERLPAATVRSMLAQDAELIDVRPTWDFSAGHIPGALSIPLRAVFASWLGWLAPDDRPLIVVRRPDQDAAEIAWQAAKIGYRLAGELEGGLEAWDGELTRTRLVGPGEIDGAVLDVRQDSEFEAGHLPRAQHIELGALAGRTDEVRGGSLVVMCGHGERAMTAASLLERAGHRDLAVLAGGTEDWAAVRGRDLETT
ncbi:glyoxylase-like metal-dependent hydrolase (beta-lactamase superfamily II) [Kribbella amoyensis]|uniref:Glyoxylase-like metal-dependent hydrolase (Beta-lactamase superfamily II) n=1 Tax=Kribbella amoyensis TaxID=996641 RepID=A0A561BYS0_9ACTN|nr:MBL fold metallo-hydrolase [Kribbella amoyensis]TWD84017.1 glyoxylase-like metal-dependent hydrolase (beta-lactamase superfamily II) [Kribbella amoyensis]